MEQFKDMEDRFEELIGQRFEKLITGLTRKVDFEAWPDYIFFFRGDEYLFEYELNSGDLWCDWKNVCSFLECEGQYDYDGVKEFIKNQVEHHLKLHVVIRTTRIFNGWTYIKKHFKLKTKKP